MTLNPAGVSVTAILDAERKPHCSGVHLNSFFQMLISHVDIPGKFLPSAFIHFSSGQLSVFVIIIDFRGLLRNLELQNVETLYVCSLVSFTSS